jgi:hypothetical protein
MLEVLTIAPPPLRRISAASATIAVQCERKFTSNCSSMSSSANWLVNLRLEPAPSVTEPFVGAVLNLMAICGQEQSPALDRAVDELGGLLDQGVKTNQIGRQLQLQRDAA